MGLQNFLIYCRQKKISYHHSKFQKTPKIYAVIEPRLKQHLLLSFCFCLVSFTCLFDGIAQRCSLKMQVKDAR